MLGNINLSLARRTMLRQLGWAADYDGATENLQITNLKNVYSGEYSLKADFSGDVVGQSPAGLIQGTGQYLVKNADPSPFGITNKYAECTSSGTAAFICNQVFGKWEFDLYKGGDNNITLVGFINDRIAGWPNYIGYAFDIDNFERVVFPKYTGGGGSVISWSANSYTSISTWYRVKIERLTNGQFTTYIKGGSFGNEYVLVSTVGGNGSNPTTDNTYTSSNYFVIDLDQGDRIANITCEYGTGSFDLSGFERILHSGNRDFELPVAYGPELIVNGSFNSNLNNWVPFGSDSSIWEDGRAKITGNNEGRKQSIATTPGKLYQLSGKFQKGSVLGSVAAAGNVPIVRNLTSITNDPFAYYFTADASVTEIRLYTSAGLETDYCYFDEISVKEVLSDWQGSGNHSCYVTGEEKKSGSFCLKMISSGAGDALNNYIELPASKFRILKDRDKYTIDGPFARGTGILGGNLLNGDESTFTNGYGTWATDANSTREALNGELRIFTAGAGYTCNTAINKPATFLSGRTYKLTFKARSNQASRTLGILSGGTSATASIQINNTMQTYTAIVTFESGTYLTFRTGFQNSIAGEELYLDDIVVQLITPPNITVVIGGKQKATTGISCIPGTFTKLVHNFECTEAEVNQPIRIYSNQADIVYLDDVGMNQAYDGVMLAWVYKNGNPSNNARIINLRNSVTSANYRLGFTSSSAGATIQAYDGVNNIIKSAGNVTDAKWHLLCGIFNRTDSAKLYIDGVYVDQVSLASLGRVMVNGAGLGDENLTSYLNGEAQITRFNNINLSDFDATKYFKSQIPRKYSGGGALVCLHMKFKGPDDATFLKDYSPLQQLVTGVNVTKAGDQVRGAYPYYSR